MTMAVPHNWTRMITLLHEAQVEQDAITAPETPQAGRDVAIRRYTALVDELVGCLHALRQDHTLGRITMHLIPAAALCDSRFGIPKMLES
jgi:hypothetical protein